MTEKINLKTKNTHTGSKTETETTERSTHFNMFPTAIKPIFSTHKTMTQHKNNLERTIEEERESKTSVDFNTSLLQTLTTTSTTAIIPTTDISIS